MHLENKRDFPHTQDTEREGGEGGRGGEEGSAIKSFRPDSHRDYMVLLDTLSCPRGASTVLLHVKSHCPQLRADSFNHVSALHKKHRKFHRTGDSNVKQKRVCVCVRGALQAGFKTSYSRPEMFKNQVITCDSIAYVSKSLIIWFSVLFFWIRRGWNELPGLCAFYARSVCVRNFQILTESWRFVRNKKDKSWERQECWKMWNNLRSKYVYF